MDPASAPPLGGYPTLRGMFALCVACMPRTARTNWVQLGLPKDTTTCDQLIRPGTRSIAESGAVRQDLRSKINSATTSSAQAINHIQAWRSA